MLSEIELRAIEPRHALVIAATVQPEDLGATLASVLPRVWALVQSAGYVMTGPPFTRNGASHADGSIEIEAGITVAGAVAGDGDIRCVELPACEAASVSYFGPYEEICAAYEALGLWVKENGRSTAGSCWEEYLTDPGAEPDPSKWETRVYWPVR